MVKTLRDRCISLLVFCIIVTSSVSIAILFLIFTGIPGSCPPGSMPSRAEVCVNLETCKASSNVNATGNCVDPGFVPTSIYTCDECVSCGTSKCLSRPWERWVMPLWCKLVLGIGWTLVVGFACLLDHCSCRSESELSAPIIAFDASDDDLPQNIYRPDFPFGELV